MAPSSKSPKRRYLTLLEVADLTELDASLPRRERRRRIERQFRTFERRDGVKYLHQTGGVTSPLKVCTEDLHLLDPWDPSTVQKLRQDLDALADQHSRLKRRFNKLEEWAEKTSDYMKQLAQTGPQLAPKSVH